MFGCAHAFNGKISSLKNLQHFMKNVVLHLMCSYLMPENATVPWLLDRRCQNAKRTRCYWINWSSNPQFDWLHWRRIWPHLVWIIIVSWFPPPRGWKYCCGPSLEWLGSTVVWLHPGFLIRLPSTVFPTGKSIFAADRFGLRPRIFDVSGQWPSLVDPPRIGFVCGGWSGQQPEKPEFWVFPKMH